VVVVCVGRDLLDELITRSEGSYRVGCGVGVWGGGGIIVCDLETSRTRRLSPELGRCAKKKKENKSVGE